MDGFIVCSCFFFVLGNQGYDASIIQQDRKEKFIEITSYIDGKWEYQDAKRLNTRGYGKIRFGDNKSLKHRARDYLKDVLKNITKKSLKDYSRVSLLFVVETFDYFEIYDISSQSFVDELIKEIQNFKFKAGPIYLFVLNNQSVSQIDQNIYLVE